MKPFLSGRAQVATPALQALADTAPPAPAAGAGRPGQTALHPHAHVAGESSGGATVECVRQGDKVVRLIVTCSCGERTEIECLYPAGG